VIGRFLAAGLAVGLVVFATVLESDTGKLSAQRTAAQVVKAYGVAAKASCLEKRGYWSYVCRVRRTNPAATVTVHVRVDDNGIVDRSDP
jgi:hypothetical protein